MVDGTRCRSALLDAHERVQTLAQENEALRGELFATRTHASAFRFVPIGR